MFRSGEAGESMARRTGGRQGSCRKGSSFVGEVRLQAADQGFSATWPALAAASISLRNVLSRSCFAWRIATAIASNGDELAGKPCAQGALVGHAVVDELAVYVVDRSIKVPRAPLG